MAVTGAADIPVELIRRMDDELPFSTIITGYGLTEAGTAAATSPGDDVETIATTVGRPRPGFEMRIVDGDGARRAGRGARRDPAPRRQRHGRLPRRPRGDRRRRSPPTGGCAPATSAWSTRPGCLRIVGRAKDMFIVGGFNAYPAEIENVLLRHPDIAQAAVIGDPRRAPGRGRHGLRACARRRGRPAPTSSAGAGTRWPTTRSPGRWSSSTSCRSTPPERCVKDVLRERAAPGRSGVDR